jgi:hypothetical protein
MPQPQDGTSGVSASGDAGNDQGVDTAPPQDGQNMPAADENQFTADNDPAAENQDNAQVPQYGPTPPQYGPTPPMYGPTQPQDMGQRPEYGQRQDHGQRPYYPRQQRPHAYHNNSVKPPLSNGLKVFLTMLFTLLPGIGQIAGIITAIVFMSSDGDDDRRSFGVALLVAAIAMFVLSCLGCFLLYTIGESVPFY